MGEDKMTIKIATFTKQENGIKTENTRDGYKLIEIVPERIGYGTYLKLWKPGTKNYATIFIDSEEIDALIEMTQKRYPNAQVWKTPAERRRMRR